MAISQPIKARQPRGFVDRFSSSARVTRELLRRITSVYERYGFDPIELPIIDYTEALGRFLPDQERPNAGVFSFTDDDDQWLSLRYDMTAPLARHVGQYYHQLTKPYRTYRVGEVFRNEKPGPGRFRQFTQLDADTIGAASVTADSEICMMAADCLAELGMDRTDFVIKVNNRKLLDGVLEQIGLADQTAAAQRLAVMRAIDKYERLGLEGVALLLGDGRRDDSGDYTKGAGLTQTQIAPILAFVNAGSGCDSADAVFSQLEPLMGSSTIGQEAIRELAQMAELFAASDYGFEQIRIDPSIVRGLEYYTGPVFEAELNFETTNDHGDVVRFGAIGGGGRYDTLIGRFLNESVPATGFSVGLSRLEAALAAKNLDTSRDTDGPVIVLVMDRDRIADYQTLTNRLRGAGLRAEMYVGNAGMRAQMKYADKRGAPAVIIQGSEEYQGGCVQIKDLAKGRLLASDIEDNATWRQTRPAQISVPLDEMVAYVQNIVTGSEGPTKMPQVGDRSADALPKKIATANNDISTRATPSPEKG